MRTVIFIFSIFIFTISCAQQPDKKYFFQEVGWTVTIPAGFKIIDSATNAALNAKGEKEIEESNNMKIAKSETKTFFTATKEPHDYVGSTITAFDPKKDGDFSANIQNVKELTYKTFMTQMPNAKIDSSTTSATIDGLNFDKYRISVTMDGKVLVNMFLLSKYYKGYDFNITYVCFDDNSKDLVESSLNNSKFAK
jgi:hypothetical protein